MIRLRHIGTAAVAALLALALTACGGLPTSGPVNPGQQITDEEADSDFIFIPDGPAKNASPQQIVEGFIAAGSGASNSWAKAKEFLAPEFRDQWRPQAAVTVYAPGQRTLDEVTADEFQLTVTPVAAVDDTGELSVSADGGDIPLTYKLAEQSDGQWRITQAPDGVVLDRNRFTAVFGSYALQFFDLDWTYLIPDTRWFPKVSSATSIAEALVDGGPADWLKGSVATAFADGAQLAAAAVPVRANVAEVSLQDGARSLEQTTLDRMQTQLEASLLPANVVGVDMLVDDQLLPADAIAVSATRIDSRPLVRTDDAFGFASGDEVESIVGLSDAIMTVDATDIEVSPDRTVAAVRDTDGVVSSVASDGTVLPLDDRSGLVAPSIDTHGFIWTVPSGSPASVFAYAPDGTRVEPANAWPGAAEVLAQRVSRDGTRIAAVVRDGAQYAVWAAGILRDRNTGTPTGLGERKLVANLPSGSGALTWLDAGSLAVVVTDGGEPYLLTQLVGGFSATVRAPADITTVSGGTQSGGVRLRDEEGELYGQRGSTWQRIASKIDVLAIQQGSP